MLYDITILKGIKSSKIKVPKEIKFQNQKFQYPKVPKPPYYHGGTLELTCFGKNVFWKLSNVTFLNMMMLEEP